MKEPTAPGAPGLEQACQGHPGRDTTLLVLHLSNLDHPWAVGSGLISPSNKMPFGFQLGLETAREPRAAGTLWLEYACQKDHGKATRSFTFGACIGKGTSAKASSLVKA